MSLIVLRVGLKMHRYGLATAASCSTATQIMKRVAERGLRADLLERAHTCYVEGDHWCALHGYQLAAECGFEVAQSNVATMLLRRQRELMSTQRSGEQSKHALDDDANAARLLQRLFDAAEQNSATAYRLLGDLHYDGALVQRAAEHKRAVAFYEAASSRRDAEATFSLGYMHHHGLGVPVDAHLGQSDCCQLLRFVHYHSSMCSQPNDIMICRRKSILTQRPRHSSLYWR